MIVCDGVSAGRFGGFGPMPGMQQPGAQEEIPFVVSFDYFNIKNSGLK
jgi:hypothetical protein